MSDPDLLTAPEQETTLSQARAFPTSTSGPIKVHESCLRAYQILKVVKRWLRAGVPAPIILELVADMESGPGGVFRGEPTFLYPEEQR